MDTSRLTALIDEKADVLSQLRELVRRQAEIVHDGDMGKLLRLLAMKQALLNQLQELEHKLDPFRHQDPEARQWQSPHHRQQTRDMATRCESLLAEIMVIEKQCENELIVRRDSAATRLQGLHSATQATHAYTQSTLGGHQLDLSSEA